MPTYSSRSEAAKQCHRIPFYKRVTFDRVGYACYNQPQYPIASPRRKGSASCVECFPGQFCC
jgi:hypothetical protein